MPKKKHTQLKPKQELFCQEFLKDMNATNACQKAGYGSSPSSAASHGSRLLRNINIQRRIKELNEQRQIATGVTPEFVLQELMKLATVDIADCYDESGNLLNIKQIPKATRAAMNGIDVFEDKEGFGSTKKVKLYDKTKALEMIGRHLKLFTDKVEHFGNITLENILDNVNDPKEKK